MSSGTGGWSADTLAVHAGERQQPPRPAATIPIYQTAPFAFATADELVAAFASSDQAGVYTRHANPTVRAVEEKLAALEGAADAVAFASGMAAITTTLATLLRPGDRLIAAAELYGGTHAWIGWFRERHPEVAVETAPLATLADAITDAALPPSLVLVESPTNPLLVVADLAAIANATHARGGRLIVDNTFATPLLQQPLALGADLVVHSATKFLGGHDDVTAGLVAADAATTATLRQAMILGGACLDPHAAYLLGRGMKTLAVRLERAVANARRLAAFLAAHPAVRAVHYPGNDPIAALQMRAPGAVLAFDVGDGAAAARVLEQLRLVRILPSLGGVDTSIMPPAITSHRALSAEARRAIGIGDGLLRVSCGIEDGGDIERDFAAALAGLA